MKRKIFYILSVVLFLIQSCDQKRKGDGCYGASYEIRPSTSRDTINLTDCSGKKQGTWYLFKTAVVHHTIYSQSTGDTFINKGITSEPEQVLVEKGIYKDNKKQGYWKKFSPSGNILDSVEFKDGIVVK